MPIERIEKIAIFVIDGLRSNAALSGLVVHNREKVVLICNSKGYRCQNSTFGYRLKDAYRKRGLYFMTCPTFSYEYYRLFTFIGAIVNNLLRRPRKVYSLREIAGRYGAQLVPTDNINSPEMIRLLKQTQPDLIIVAFFDQLVGTAVLEIPRVAAMNIHPSLLPNYRGPVPNFWALLHGEKQVGATVHLLDEAFDTGAILKQGAVETPHSNNILAIDIQMIKIGVELAIEAITEIEDGSRKPVRQQGGSYYSHPSREDVKGLRRKGIRLYSFGYFVKCFF